MYSITQRVPYFMFFRAFSVHPFPLFGGVPIPMYREALIPEWISREVCSSVSVVKQRGV